MPLAFFVETSTQDASIAAMHGFSPSNTVCDDVPAKSTEPGTPNAARVATNWPGSSPAAPLEHCRTQ